MACTRQARASHNHSRLQPEESESPRTMATIQCSMVQQPYVYCENPWAGLVCHTSKTSKLHIAGGHRCTDSHAHSFRTPSEQAWLATAHTTAVASGAKSPPTAARTTMPARHGPTTAKLPYSSGQARALFQSPRPFNRKRPRALEAIGIYLPITTTANHTCSSRPRSAWQPFAPTTAAA